MDFGERLITVRKEHGYTRESLANALGISKYTLRNYELGATEPGHTFLKQISDFFHVSIDYLMGLTNEQEILESLELNTSEKNIIKKYRDLDDHGKEIVDVVLEKEYDRCHPAHTKMASFSHPVTKAAHARTDIERTPEGKAHDDALMENDEYWK